MTLDGGAGGRWVGMGQGDARAARGWLREREAAGELNGRAVVVVGPRGGVEGDELFAEGAGTGAPAALEGMAGVRAAEAAGDEAQGPER